MCGIPVHVKIETFINHVPITIINDQGGAIGALGLGGLCIGVR